jgi:hypothetical protein
MRLFRQIALIATPTLILIFLFLEGLLRAVGYVPYYLN